MGIYTIYRAKNNINGKIYIGFDSSWPKRKNEHKNSFLKEDIVFYRAIRKYGWDNFVWEILYQSRDKYHTKNVMENYFIEEYRTFIHFEDCLGYNMTLGGEGATGNIPSEQTKQKIKNTWKINHGNIDNVFQLDFVKEKIKQTCLLEYGEEHYSRVQELKEKSKQTCLEKYGVEYTFQIPKLKKISLERIKEKYKNSDISNVSQIEEIKNKKINTSLKNWGVEYTMQSSAVKQKSKETWKNKSKEELLKQNQKTKKTNIEIYGYEYSSQNPKIKEKIKTTCIKKYGTESYTQSEEGKEKLKNSLKEKYGVDNISKLPFLSIIETKKTYAKNMVSRYFPEFKQHY